MPKPRLDGKTDWNTTVRLEKELHRVLKTVAALQGVPLQDFVRIAVEERLKKLGLIGLLEMGLTERIVIGRSSSAQLPPTEEPSDKGT